MKRPKVPARPARPLPAPRPADITSWNDGLVRIMRTEGDHLLPWNALRTAGPIPGFRWEPHPPGEIQDYPDHGVSYQAQDFTTAVAEVFQRERRVDVHHGAPVACFWRPTRPLELLDLTSDWPLRAGASAALAAAPRPVCRAWAHAVRTDLPTLDGLRTRSTMTGRDVVVLFTPGADAFPPSPDAVVRLETDEALSVLEIVVDQIGYALG